MPASMCKRSGGNRAELRGCEKMGTGSGTNRPTTAAAGYSPVPVPIFSQPPRACKKTGTGSGTNRPTTAAAGYSPVPVPIFSQPPRACEGMLLMVSWEGEAPAEPGALRGSAGASFSRTSGELNLLHRHRRLHERFRDRPRGTPLWLRRRAVCPGASGRFFTASDFGIVRGSRADRPLAPRGGSDQPSYRGTLTPLPSARPFAPSTRRTDRGCRTRY